MEFPGDQYFTELTTKERAVFELGIKLGTLYHSATGMPLKNDPKVLEAIAEGLKASIGCQPFVHDINVGFNQARLLSNGFNYGEISGKNLKSEITVKYKDARAKGVLEWREGLKYPLMSVLELESEVNPKA